MNANNVSPVRPVQIRVTGDPYYEGPGLYTPEMIGALAAKRLAREDLKWYLMSKYRTLFIDRLTVDDVEELQYYHRQQYDPKHGWDHQYLRKFVLKLREYMQDEILKQEIAGIETLMILMKPGDLEHVPRFTEQDAADSR